MNTENDVGTAREGHLGRPAVRRRHHGAQARGNHVTRHALARRERSTLRVMPPSTTVLCTSIVGQRTMVSVRYENFGRYRSGDTYLDGNLGTFGFSFTDFGPNYNQI
jgi:hypothetical protein